MLLRNALKAFFIVAAFCLASCEKTETTPASKPQVVEIGAVLPLTGATDVAEYGKSSKRGIELAVEEVNRSGGQQFNVVFEDSQCLPTPATNAIQKLISLDKVKVVIGDVCSSATLAMVPIATRSKITLFSHASSSPELTGCSPYFFRNWPSDTLEAGKMAELAYKHLGLRRACVLYVNNAYGLGLKDVFVASFEKLGGSVDTVEAYQQGARDFRTQLTKIKNANPESLYMAGYHAEMGVALRQAGELGISCQILGAADFGFEGLIEKAGEYAEGAIHSMPAYSPTASDAVVKKFVSAYKDKWHDVPDIFAAHAYDAFRIIAHAIKQNGNAVDAIRQALLATKDFPGAAGSTSLNADGDAIKPVAFRIVRDGKFVPYKPED
jgi:branched-chain amino acid transport system substrate-binding protein